MLCRRIVGCISTVSIKRNRLFGDKNYMTDTEYAVKIYCQVFCVASDNGDACTDGVLSVVRALSDKEQTALESYFRYNKTFKQTGLDLGGIKSETTRNFIYKALLKLKHPAKLQYMSKKIHQMGYDEWVTGKTDK